MAYIVFYDATDIDQRQLTEQLSHTDHHWEFVSGPLTDENVREDAEVISVFVNSKVPERLLARFHRLRLIACRSTGFNNVDLAAATARDITVANVPSYGSDTVAEYAFALILSLSRKLRPMHEAVEKGQVDLPMLTGFDLKDKTIGLLGAGRIGQSVARIAKGFGMRIVAFDPFADQNNVRELGIELLPLESVLEQCDILTIHMPFTGKNKHIVNEDALSRLKPGALVINTARGELIDTAALLAALKDGKLGGAALDVLEGESLIDIDEEFVLLRGTENVESMRHSAEIRVLEKMPNVIISPHNAFNTVEAIGRINGTTAENIIRYWYGEVPNAVKPAAPTPGKLIVARHGESEWNALGKWTGSTDVHLTEKGFREAAMQGVAIKDVHIDYAFTSQQIRALETLESMLDASQQFDVPFERDAAINERDYGDYTGKNKWDMQSMLGDAAFQALRRGWDVHVPNGETLKDVYARVEPFYMEKVLPRIHKGQNVLIVAHGNSIRSMMKYIESVSDDAIEQVEMLFGEIVIYNLDEHGKMTSKEVRKIDSSRPPA